MKIYVRVRNIYGNELVYPACEQSRGLAALIGARTFTPDKLAIIRRLGYRIEVQAAQLPRAA